jgi:hypothetical protein
MGYSLYSRDQED